MKNLKIKSGFRTTPIPGGIQSRKSHHLFEREYLCQWNDGTIQPTPAPQVVIDPTPAQKELAELFGDKCYDFEKTYDLLINELKDAEVVIVKRELFFYICEKIKAFPIIQSFNGFNWYVDTSLELYGTKVYMTYNNVEKSFSIVKKEKHHIFDYIKS